MTKMRKVKTHPLANWWVVQTGKGKGSYKTRYTQLNKASAYLLYTGIHTHSGYKKRLIDPEGFIVERFISND